MKLTPARLTWDTIDLDGVLVPSEAAKGRRDGTIPMTPPVARALYRSNSLRLRSDTREQIVPSSRPALESMKKLEGVIRTGGQRGFGLGNALGRFALTLLELLARRSHELLGPISHDNYLDTHRHDRSAMRRSTPTVQRLLRPSLRRKPKKSRGHQTSLAHTYLHWIRRKGAQRVVSRGQNYGLREEVDAEAASQRNRHRSSRGRVRINNERHVSNSENRD